MCVAWIPPKPDNYKLDCNNDGDNDNNEEDAGGDAIFVFFFNVNMIFEYTILYR